MKRLALTLAAALSLPACATTAPTPVSYAIAAETMYTAASKAGGDLVRAKKLDAARYKALDQAAYDALLRTRALVPITPETK